MQPLVVYARASAEKGYKSKNSVTFATLWRLSAAPQTKQTMQRKKYNPLPLPVALICNIALSYAIFMLCRIVFLAVNSGLYAEGLSGNSLGDLLRGSLLFDTSAICYLSLPYLLVLLSAVIIVSLDGFSFETNFTAVLATLSNIGPGLGMVGPVGNYAAFSNLSKLVLSFCMLVGRLEVFPMLMLFAPSAWKK